MLWSIKQKSEDTAKYFLDLLFPIQCLGCKKYGEHLCGACVKTIKEVKQVCFVCRKKSEGGYTHEPCHQPLMPRRLLSASTYSEILVKKIIQNLKFDFIQDLAKDCAKIMQQRIIAKEKYDQNWIVTFVPMHKHKQSIRGFNQAQLIAEHLSGLLGLENIALLLKTRATLAQNRLNREQRLTNLKGAFTLNPMAKDKIKGRKILLIDDLITTGSTLKECTAILFENGATTVHCLTFARD